MNLTLSIDEKVVRRARRIARSMGKSVNQLIREYLDHLTALDDAQRDVEELARLSEEGAGHSRGWKFDREEIHDRT